MFYFILYVVSELSSQILYLGAYYSAVGTIKAVKYIVSNNSQIDPQLIKFCPYNETCHLDNENDFEVVITEESALYDIKHLLIENAKHEKIF